MKVMHRVATGLACQAPFKGQEVELGSTACFPGARQRYSVASSRGLRHWQARVTSTELVGEKDKRNSVRKRGLRIVTNLREGPWGKRAAFKPFLS